MNLHSLFCCFVQLFFHLHTKHETTFTNNLSRCQNYTSISPDRKIFIEFAPPCIGTKIYQTLLHVREGQDQFSINNVELIAINQFVLVEGSKVMYSGDSDSEGASQNSTPSFNCQCRSRACPHCLPVLILYSL